YTCAPVMAPRLEAKSGGAPASPRSRLSANSPNSFTMLSDWPFNSPRARERSSCVNCRTATAAKRKAAIARLTRKSATSRVLRDRRGIVGNLVADTPNGHDRARVADLAPELAHVHVDRARIAGERVAPDALEQLVARQHEPAVVEQLPEQVEFLGGELHGRAVHEQLAPARIDRDQPVRAPPLRDRRRRGRAAQD